MELPTCSLTPTQYPHHSLLTEGMRLFHHCNKPACRIQTTTGGWCHWSAPWQHEDRCSQCCWNVNCWAWSKCMGDKVASSKQECWSSQEWCLPSSWCLGTVVSQSSGAACGWGSLCHAPINKVHRISWTCWLISTWALSLMSLVDAPGWVMLSMRVLEKFSYCRHPKEGTWYQWIVEHRSHHHQLQEFQRQWYP